MFPEHPFVFAGMLRNTCRAVETSSATQVAEQGNQDHNTSAQDSKLMMVCVVEIQKLTDTIRIEKSTEPTTQRTGLASRFNRALFIGFGFACLICAAAGAILPLIPCTPFVLLAAYCFARSSPRLHTWLKQSRLFGPFIRDWQTRRAIHVHTKRFALIVVAMSLAGTLYFVHPNLILSGVIVGVISIGIVVILRLPTYS